MLALYSLVSSAGLQLPGLFGTHPLQGELRALQESLGAATELLPRDVACARAALKSGLVAQQEGQHWVTHADKDLLIAALLGPTKALLGVAYRPQMRELAIALLDGGTFVHRGGEQFETPVLGNASPVSNVISTPAEWCHEMDDLVVHLQQTGLGVPLRLIPRGSKDELRGAARGAARPHGRLPRADRPLRRRGYAAARRALCLCFALRRGRWLRLGRVRQVV
jgi:hypothetical protein